MNIRVNHQPPIAEIELNRPQVHHAFDDRMMQEITAALQECAVRDDLRAVVIRSTGPSFCAGADVHWMRRMVNYTQAENVADARLLSNMLRTIRELPKPVIVRVQGAAYGGGVGLIAAADMAVAVASARFCLSEVKLGIVPAVISPFVIEKIGTGQARRYALTAELFDAVQALKLGLIQEVCADDTELDQWIAKIVEQVCRNGPQAMAACKQILSRVAGQDWPAVEEFTVQRIAEIRISPEGQEGLRAFLDKRTPGWMHTE
ncbi:MAG: Enoyl-CoA-hydratase [Phycisphaerae bacterium]|nr:Enoyl-CoA-hydratase [Phycisphaerae bacterium]